MKTIQSFEDLNSPAFQQRLNENTQSILLDVHTQDEFKQGHIPGSVNMDVMDIAFYDHVGSLDKNQTYFVYCRSGGRSRQAYSIMSDLGLTAINLAGGILDWSGKVTSDNNK